MKRSYSLPDNDQDHNKESRTTKLSKNWLVLIWAATIVIVAAQIGYLMIEKESDGILVREMGAQSTVRLTRSIENNRYVRPLAEKAREVDSMLSAFDERLKADQLESKLVADQLNELGALALTLPAAQRHVRLTDDGDVELIPGVSFSEPKTESNALPKLDSQDGVDIPVARVINNGDSTMTASDFVASQDQPLIKAARVEQKEFHEPYPQPLINDVQTPTPNERITKQPVADLIQPHGAKAMESSIFPTF